MYEKAANPSDQRIGSLGPNLTEENPLYLGEYERRVPKHEQTFSQPPVHTELDEKRETFNQRDVLEKVNKLLELHEYRPLVFQKPSSAEVHVLSHDNRILL